MIAVVPMAGNSQRFLDAGYLTPKPFLSLPNGNTIIEEIFNTLMPNVERIVTVAKSEHKGLLHDTLDRYSSKWTWAAWTHQNTLGPLESILMAKKFINSKEELLINFCDCWLPNDEGDQIKEFVEEMRDKKRESGVVVFPSNDPRFQREPTNRYAMTGIYWFKSGAEFVKMALQYKEFPHIGPGHLAFMYRKWLISQAGAFVTKNYVDLGVPEAFEFYKTVHSRKLVMPTDDNP